MKRRALGSPDSDTAVDRARKYIFDTIGKGGIWSETSVDDSDKMPLLKEFLDIGYRVFVLDHKGEPIEIPKYVFEWDLLGEVLSHYSQNLDWFKVELSSPQPPKEFSPFSSPYAAK